jgi:hypothetical protein
MYYIILNSQNNIKLIINYYSFQSFIFSIIILMEFHLVYL